MTTPLLTIAKWLPGLVILLGLAAGCARSRDLQPLELQTRITSGGLKLFELRLPVREHRVEPPTNPHRRQRRSPDDRHSQKPIHQMVDQALEQSGYCRDGYVLLGRYAGETVRRIRGECRERATEDDRHRFPDTVERW